MNSRNSVKESVPSEEQRKYKYFSYNTFLGCGKATGTGGSAVMGPFPETSVSCLDVESKEGGFISRF